MGGNPIFLCGFEFFFGCVYVFFVCDFSLDFLFMFLFFVVGGGCEGTFGVELVGSSGNDFLVLSGGVALFLHI